MSTYGIDASLGATDLNGDRPIESYNVTIKESGRIISQHSTYEAARHAMDKMPEPQNEQPAPRAQFLDPDTGKSFAEMVADQNDRQPKHVPHSRPIPRGKPQFEFIKA
jgi:hypothetical protein